MSRTHHHSHLPQTKNRKRANVKRKLRTAAEREGKPAKAARKHNRDTLRRYIER